MREQYSDHGGTPQDGPLELMSQFEWIINIIPGDSELWQQGYDVVEALRKQHGEGNVLVSLGALNSDSGEITRVPGKVGVFIRKGVDRPKRNAQPTAVSHSQVENQRPPRHCVGYRRDNLNKH